MVDTGILVGTHEFAQAVGVGDEGVFVVVKQIPLQITAINHDGIASHTRHYAIMAGHDDLTTITGGQMLDTGTDNWCIRAQQRHRLALHVGTHQGSVGVVVLKEGDECRRDTDHLLG